MTPTDLALWLAHHTDAIACDEAAGQIYNDIRNIVERIEQVINRPVPPRECGPCPTQIEGQQKPCSHALTAPRDAQEVTCSKCRTTYNIERLIARTLNRANSMLFTRSQLVEALTRLGEHVPTSTLYRWCAENKLFAHGERDGQPAYRLSEARELARRSKRKNHTDVISAC